MIKEISLVVILGAAVLSRPFPKRDIGPTSEPWSISDSNALSESGNKSDSSALSDVGDKRDPRNIRDMAQGFHGGQDATNSNKKMIKRMMEQGGEDEGCSGDLMESTIEEFTDILEGWDQSMPEPAMDCMIKLSKGNADHNCTENDLNEILTFLNNVTDAVCNENPQLLPCLQELRRRAEAEADATQWSPERLMRVTIEKILDIMDNLHQDIPASVFDCMVMLSVANAVHNCTENDLNEILTFLNNVTDAVCDENPQLLPFLQELGRRAEAEADATRW